MSEFDKIQCCSWFAVRSPGCFVDFDLTQTTKTWTNAILIFEIKGLANLFQGNSDIFQKLSQSVNDQQINKFSLYEIFQNYLNDTIVHYSRIQDWNDMKNPEAQM